MERPLASTWHFTRNSYPAYTGATTWPSRGPFCASANLSRRRLKSCRGKKSSRSVRTSLKVGGGIFSFVSFLCGFFVGFCVGFLWVFCGFFVGFCVVFCGFLCGFFVGFLLVFVWVFVWVFCGFFVGFLWVFVGFFVCVRACVFAYALWWD